MNSVPNAIDPSVNHNSQIILSRKIRFLLFCILSFIGSILMLSNSVFSASVTVIKSELNLTNRQFGMFGSFLGIGHICGSLIYIILSGIFSRKYLFLLSLVICSCSHLFFFVTKYFYFLLLIRLMAGIGQSIGFCYLPTWVEQFAIRKYKSWMITILNIAENFGQIWGYLFSLILTPVKWKYNLLFETSSILIFLPILLLIHKKYFNKELISDGTANKLCESQRDTNQDKKEPSNFTVFRTIEEVDRKKVQNSYSNDDNNNNIIENFSQKKKQRAYLKHKFCLLIINIQYISLLFCKSVENFINTAQTFWYSDYIQDAFKIKNDLKIFKSFTSSYVIAPICGVLISGFIVSRLGGYYSLKSLAMMTIFSIITSGIAIYAGFTKNFINFTIFNILFNLSYNISSNFIILLSVEELPPTMKGYALGLFQFALQFLAFFPAPLAYAEIKLYFNSSKIAMQILMSYSAVGSLCIIWCLINKICKRIKGRGKKKLVEVIV